MSRMCINSVNYHTLRFIKPSKKLRKNMWDKKGGTYFNDF